MSFSLKIAISLLLVGDLVSVSAPISALADDTSGDEVGDPLGPTVGAKAFSASSQDYTLPAGLGRPTAAVH